MDHRQRLDAAWRRHQSGDRATAEAEYREVIRLAPGRADAHVFLGIAQFDKRDFAGSVASYDRALQIDPDQAIAWNNRGNSLRMLGQVDDAETCFARALQLRPQYLSALKNRGTLWIWAGEIERGLESYQRALELAPEDPEVHRNLGVIYLLLGKSEDGWRHYRWRWHSGELKRPTLPGGCSHWSGEDLRDQSFLLYPEQGLGDAMHFVRVTKRLCDMGAQVCLHVEPKWLPLFSSVDGYASLSADRGQMAPACRYHASMIEVVDRLIARGHDIHDGAEFRDGLAFDDDADSTRRASTPRQAYLGVAPPLVEYWKKWLDKVAPQNAPTPKRRIAITWQGNRDHHADIYRSIDLSCLAPLLARDDVHVISLQRGDAAEQVVRGGWENRVIRVPDDFDSSDGAFTDSAALVQHVDAVLSTDTSIVHLAGSVGVRTWVMLGRVPDWRWGLEGDRTPWYPSMRLLRQKTLGSWDDVVASALRKIDHLTPG
ncbi:MAG: tetratricopeptide repeat-containing glycosyltransferase family protein [Planctomycetota bacterium]